MANLPQNRDAAIDADISHGIDVDSLEKEGVAWAQNVEFRANRLEVRQGFGTLAQFGTTLNAGRTGGTTYGYGPPLGATLHVTNQRHIQILSVHPLSAYTGTLGGQTLDSLFALSVFDVTTGRRAEHVFRQQTQWVSNMPEAVLPSTAQPGWLARPMLQAPGFAQLADLQYICMPGQGVWVYRPIDTYPVDQRLQSVAGTLQNGDDAWVETLVPVDGVFALAGNTYFNSSTFPAPQCICAFQNRMVYASGRKLYFSDVDRPDNVLANSFYPVPTELPITALATVKGVLLVFTASETWMYQPSNPTQTGLISGGNIYNLSSSQGCLSPQSLVLMGDSVVFLDKRGIYVTDGGTQVQKISEPIDSWFSLSEQMQNPLANYLTQLGLGTLANEQPRAFIDFTGQLARATMAWDSQNTLLYITLADLSLVYNPSYGWSVNLYETTAVPLVNGQTVVGLQRNILNPIVLAYGSDTYMVGGVDQTDYADITDASVYILEFGRGGGLDRSSVSQEDLRQPYQFWVRGTSAVATAPAYYVAPPILLPQGYKTTSQTTLAPTWCVPIYLAGQSAGSVADISSLQLTLQFDNTNWQPLLLTAQDDHYAYLVPPNRLKSAAAFTDMRVYTGVTPDYLGNVIHIKWNGPGAANAWTAYPHMVINPTLPQPIVYLLMQRRNGASLTTSIDMGWSVESAFVNPLGTSVDAQCYIAQESGAPAYPQQDLGNNTQAQPVDWAVATPLLGDGKAQYKARGTFASVQSFGKATTQKVAGWPVGPYGTTTTSDYKDFSAQIRDWEAGDPHEIQNIATPRFRIQATSAAAPSAKVGGGVATWSDSTAQTTGNMLIDDPATDTIATSEGVRGERFKTMLFGCINANGERVKFSKVRILTRMTGGLRRSGRRGLT